MHRIGLRLGVVGLVVLTAAAIVPIRSAAQHRPSGPAGEYVVLYRNPHAGAAARAAIAAAGGRVLRENRGIGTALVRTANPAFASDVGRGGAVLGAAHNRPIGHLPSPRPDRELIERLSPTDRALALPGLGARRVSPPADFVLPRQRPAAGEIRPEPLAGRQWDMAMMEATATGSYATELGDRRVRVGVIDTGVDGTHPDIAPNFDVADSRNFVTDLPDTDGPCPEPSCKDPVGVDHNGHGTHVASTIAAPINGIGISGVAPNVRIVSIRAGQNSGFFLLQPVLDALTYAADAGMNVVNLSFYVDPWLYNCPNNPADNAQAQTEQRTVVEAVQRAVSYARDHSVTVVGALGNESADLDHITEDSKSPDFPAGKAYPRKIDSNCLTVPTETDGVISIGALGPSGRKAYYSNYSLKYNRFSAPGGDAYDTVDAKVDPTAQILGAYPASIARASGDVDADGKTTTPFVIRDCEKNVCAYYQYLQGTSMAAPHAAGVAALAVSRFGTPVGDRLVLDPRIVEMLMAAGADRHGCPRPAAYRYTMIGAEGKKSFTHVCTERLDTNSFYGLGMVSAGGLVLLPKLTPPELTPGPEPSAPPTPAPTGPPTPAPTAAPTGPPTPEPTAAPTPVLTPRPTPAPTPVPTPRPTPAPTGPPTPAPTAAPTPVPTPRPTPARTGPPTPRPTATPSATPSSGPTGEPAGGGGNGPADAPAPSAAPAPTPAPEAGRRG